MTTKPTVPDILPLANAYYAIPGNEVGGNLHIVLDDGNIDDDHVAFCRQQAVEDGDSVGVYLADKLLQMSKTQRLKIYRLVRRS